METLYSIVIAVHVLVAVAIIGLILMQHGKGADMGAAFGSGASGSLFGASGSANFLSRTTAVLAAIFFLTSLVLVYIVSQPKSSGSIMGYPIQSSPSEDSSIPVTPEPQTPTPAADSAPVEQPPTTDGAQNAAGAQGAGTAVIEDSAVKESTPVAEGGSKVNEIPAD